MKTIVIIIMTSFMLSSCASKTIELRPIQIYGSNEQSVPTPVYE